jgi:cyanophycinase
VRRRPFPNGVVVLIGGVEDKSGERQILGAIARRAGRGPLVICTAGSTIPDEISEVYRAVFRAVGVRGISHAAIRNREDADDTGIAEAVRTAKAFFFTGGDQLRITSAIAGSCLHRAIEELYQDGGAVAGTSAGASALGQTMPVSSQEDEHRVAAAWRLLPGLGLIPDVMIDQHFAQRGRMARLIAGVAENPRLLGIGINEDTALVWRKGEFEVIGTGAVYVVDANDVSGSNVGDPRGQSAMSAFDLRLHVLSAVDRFDAAARRPMSGLR